MGSLVGVLPFPFTGVAEAGLRGVVLGVGILEGNLLPLEDLLALVVDLLAAVEVVDGFLRPVGLVTVVVFLAAADVELVAAAVGLAVPVVDLVDNGTVVVGRVVVGRLIPAAAVPVDFPEY